MKPNIFLQLVTCAIPLLSITTACNGQTKNTPNKNTSTNSATMNTGAVKYTEGKDFTEFVRARVMDKAGFSQPVEAFSILIPKTWKFDGGIIWNPPGTTCAGVNQGVKAQSPDGKFIFEMLPAHMWAYNSDPQMRQMNQDGGNFKYCSYGEPLDAEAYFRNVFVQNELNNPEVISVKVTPGGVQAMQENNNKIRQELMQYGASNVNFYPSGIYAKVKWSNGSEGIVFCGVNNIETVIPNPYNGTSSKIFTSVASERVVFMHPASESAKAANMLSVIMGSLRTNTAWKNTIDNFWLDVRQKKQIAHIGTIKMLDEQTRQIGENTIRKGQQNLNNMDANMRNWEASQAAQDRIHTSFIKTIREVETYRDETGRIELSSGYNHAWSRSDGSSFIMSDNPNFNPSSVFQDQRWKEMKKVQ